MIDREVSIEAISGHVRLLDAYTSMSEQQIESLLLLRQLVRTLLDLSQIGEITKSPFDRSFPSRSLFDVRSKLFDRFFALFQLAREADDSSRGESETSSDF